MRAKWPRRLRRTAWGIGLGGAAIFLALRLTPLPASLENGQPVSTEFLDRNGLPLRLMLVDEQRYAQRCTLAEISPALIAMGSRIAAMLNCAVGSGGSTG